MIPMFQVCHDSRPLPLKFKVTLSDKPGERGGRRLPGAPGGVGSAEDGHREGLQMYMKWKRKVAGKKTMMRGVNVR